MSATTLPAPTSPPPTVVRRRGGTSRALPHAAMVLGAGLVVAWLASRSEELTDGLSVLGTLALGWLLVAVAASAAVQLAAAAALHAVAPRELPFARCLRIQLAGTAAAAVTPGGVGGAALHAHELARAGASRSAAWAAVVTVRTVTTLAHLAALAVAVPIVRANVLPAVTLPRWTPHVAITAVTVMVAALAATLTTTSTSARARAAVAGLWRRRPPTELLRARALTLVTGAAGTTAARGVTLWAALRAAGAQVPLGVVVAVFLTAEAAGALSGAPNGLGAFDVVALAGLEAAGAATGAAVTAVLVHRVLTLWLPIVPGLAAAARLRRR